MGIFLTVFFKVYCQFIETFIVGDALHRRYIKHIRQPSVADGEYLFLYLFIYFRSPLNPLQPV